MPICGFQAGVKIILAIVGLTHGETWDEEKMGQKRALYGISLGESMASIININNAIEEPTSGY